MLQVTIGGHREQSKNDLFHRSGKVRFRNRLANTAPNLGRFREGGSRANDPRPGAWSGARKASATRRANPGEGRNPLHNSAPGADAGVMIYGPSRLLQEICDLGYAAALVRAGDLDFVVLTDFEIVSGRFARRVIDLGLPATPDFPRSVGASIHVRANPQLLEYQNVPNLLNIIQSPLGAEWRYWSHNLNWAGERDRSAARLLYQVNGIFDRA